MNRALSRVDPALLSSPGIHAGAIQPSETVSERSHGYFTATASRNRYEQHYEDNLI
jgi:hypothetical protein